MSLAPTVTPSTPIEWIDYACSIPPRDPMWLTSAQFTAANEAFAEFACQVTPIPGVPLHIVGRRVLLADRFDAKVTWR